ncbi:MAG TPA: DUF1223 domain-containing protein [Rhizomicrobium sp.]|jgi:hypothetical protein|nr:DUF1223 domain-containing protein [Rhizomicrobium sp.]
MTVRLRPFAFAALVLFTGTAAQAGAARPVVVELYTSQGCSSCPPADSLLGKLAQRADVIAMSLPITYWDMLGWKDTLASDANTRRQKAYAMALGHGGVYTPQIIVDGVQDVVGSRVAGVEAAIEARAQLIDASMVVGNATPAGQTDPVVPVALNEDGQEMHIDIGALAGGHNATVWMFHLRSAVNVAIKAGENEGRTITYHNVVGDLRAVGVWKGSSLNLTLPRAAMSGLPHDGVAIVVQQGGSGHIIGAAYLARPDFYPTY